VYLGEHYVIDVMAGMVYATGAYWLVDKYQKFIKKRSEYEALELAAAETK
jgi:membrane-associated phospholipid phosphatase